MFREAGPRCMALAMSSPGSSAENRSLLERALGLVTDVRAGEGVDALLMTLNLFLLLTAYYMIKPLRDGLIVGLPEGATYKSGMSAAIAVALLFAVPLYGAVASRVKRNRLVVGVTLFFTLNLVLFYLGFRSESLRENLYLVLGFYAWVGIFNMMIVAQIWAFANDIYTEDQGERLFPLVGLGASLGAVLGGVIVAALVDTLGSDNLVLIAAGLLALTGLITQIVHARRSDEASEQTEAKEDAPKEKSASGGFGLVFKHRYLGLLAAFSLVFTLVNTNGEYMLSVLAKEHFGESGNLEAFYGTFYAGVNAASLVIQGLVVSRLVKYLGLGRAFFILPVVAFLDALAVAIIPMFAIIRWGKTVENSVDYSLNNTLRNMLWLPTSQEMKYKAKQAVDTFFVRMGDVGSFGLVLLLAQQLELGVRAFAITNVVLAAVWIALAIVIVRHYRRAAEGDADVPAKASA